MTVKLGEIKGNRESMGLCNALFNHKGINAYRIAIGNQDTEFTYAIYTDQKLNKLKIVAAAEFIAGFQVGLKLYF